MSAYPPRQLGKTDIVLSPLVMGTWQAGKQYWTGIDDGEMIRAIQSAFECGITAFDTAEEYGDGHSEIILGRALHKVRDQVMLMSKVFSNHLRHGQVIAACHASLKRLGTDYLDLYQIHWPSGSWDSEPVPIAETMAALTTLKEKGDIRAIGVSNFSRAQLAEAAQYGRIDSLQPCYNLFWRHVEREILPWCRDHDLSVLAYSPLAQGLLCGKFGAGHRFADGDHRSANKLMGPDHFPRVLTALEQLRGLADELGTNLSRLALAWLMAQPNTLPIAGARNREQVRDNAAAMDVSLPAEVISRMDAIGSTVAAPLMADPVAWHWQP